MSILAQQLLDIKDTLSSSEQEKSIIEGRLQELYSALKKEWGCLSIEEAKEKLEALKNENDIVDEKIDEIIIQLTSAGWEL